MAFLLVVLIHLSAIVASFVISIIASKKMGKNVLLGGFLGLFFAPIAGFYYGYAYFAKERRGYAIALAGTGLFVLYVLILMAILFALSPASMGHNYLLKEGRASVYFLSEPNTATTKQDLGNGNIVNDYLYYSGDNNNPYVLVAAYEPLAFLNVKDSPEVALKNEAEFTANAAGAEVISFEPTTYKGYPAIDYVSRSRSSGQLFVGRDIAVQNDLYTLDYSYSPGNENKDLENTFLNSLTFDR